MSFNAKNTLNLVIKVKTIIRGWKNENDDACYEEVLIILANKYACERVMGESRWDKTVF